MAWQLTCPVTAQSSQHKRSHGSRDVNSLVVRIFGALLPQFENLLLVLTQLQPCVLLLQPGDLPLFECHICSFLVHLCRAATAATFSHGERLNGVIHTTRINALAAVVILHKHANVVVAARLCDFDLSLFVLLFLRLDRRERFSCNLSPRQLASTPCLLLFLAASRRAHLRILLLGLLLCLRFASCLGLLFGLVCLLLFVSLLPALCPLGLFLRRFRSRSSSCACGRLLIFLARVAETH
mmetsp:Transcript_67405/g.133590  ORF Transcript_67405/g.133590 Transcript_67405/m.133590 type:complete len:239 (-) Transcript_67405:106-822(-)